MIILNQLISVKHFSPCTFKKKYTNFQWHKNEGFKILTTTLLFSLIVIIVISQITGCNINVKAGKRPNITALETILKSGESSSQDVLNALGTPTGKGQEMLPFMDSIRVTWTYYYEQLDLDDDSRLFLFVFFDKNNRYDGYMWFSSLPEFKPNLGS